MSEKVEAVGQPSGRLWKEFEQRYPKKKIRMGEAFVEVPDPDAIDEDVRKLRENPDSVIEQPGHQYDASTLGRISAHMRELIRQSELAQASAEAEHKEAEQENVYAAMAAYSAAKSLVSGKRETDKNS